MPLKLIVTFEAADAEKLTEAMESFVADLKERTYSGSSSFSLSTDGWSYECKRKDGTEDGV